MNTSNYSFRDSLRLKISHITERLKIHRNTENKVSYLVYVLINIFLMLIDRILRKELKIIKSVGGVNYELNTNDLIEFRVFYFGSNEAHIINYLKAQINSIAHKKEITFWDIGAHVGTVSLPLVSAFPDVRAYLFEPSPTVFKRLERNVSLNSFPVKIRSIALGNTCAKLDFFVSSLPFNSGLGSLANRQTNRHASISSTQVDCYTGDFLIENQIVPEPLFIKMDVEGYEYEVLSGLQSFLKRTQDLQIIFEHEPYRLAERELATDSVIKLLEDLGYQIYRISQATFSLKNLQPSMLQTKCDFVAIKAKV